MGQEATKGLTDLRSSIVSRTRSLSLAQRDAGEGEASSSGGVTGSEETLQEEGVLARLRSEAARRLREIERAEDAADEALLRFGTSIRGFLADAVRIAPPAEGASPDAVLFESKDAQGKRVIHTTRFDAQLHVIHVSLESFTKDPSASEEWTAWKGGFDVEKKTGEISGDLEKYAELRGAMEKLVPDQVAYKDFWTRYYFLRHSIETAEARRRDLLKGTGILLLLPCLYANDLQVRQLMQRRKSAGMRTLTTKTRPRSLPLRKTRHPPPHPRRPSTLPRSSPSTKRVSGRWTPKCANHQLTTGPWQTAKPATTSLATGAVSRAKHPKVHV